MADFENRFSVTRLASGIYRHQLDDLNFATIEAWIAQSHQEEHLALQTKTPLCILIDMRQAGYPTAYALRRLSERAKQIPADLPVNSAILIRESGVLHVLLHLIEYMPLRYQTSTRFFRAHQEAEALMWLEERYHHFVNALQPHSSV